MSRPSRTNTSTSPVLDKVESLIRSAETGVLAVSRNGWTHSRIFVLDGDVIACNSEEDNARLELLLLAEGTVECSVLDEIRPALREAGDIGDLLVQGDHIDGVTLMEARTRLFRDAFFWAVAPKDPQLIWDPRDTIFPDNMQFDVDFEALVKDARGWVVKNHHTLSLLSSGDYFVAQGPRPKEITDNVWAAISLPHAGLALVEAIGAPSREQAVGSLTALFAMGVMTVAPNLDGRETRQASAVNKGTVTEEIEVIARDGIIASNTVEGMDIALRLAGEAADDPPDVDSNLALNPVEAAIPTDESLDDYERARRGDFIKSYEVLDKVDLSDVQVLGTVDTTESSEDMPAIEMGEDYDDIDDLWDPDLDVMRGDLDEKLASPAVTQPQLEPLRENDTVESMEPGEADFDLFGNSDLPELEDAGHGTPTQAGPFPREVLSEYYETISVFNSIFRIIYHTFSKYIGADNARQRFNALLSSNQRQYPELFQNILVLDDGSVVPAPIIDNLAACTDSNHGSLLHQGLYELIFSHLYDAKDMLPVDAESAMMERILVYERQLQPY